MWHMHYIFIFIWHVLLLFRLFHRTSNLDSILTDSLLSVWANHGDDISIQYIYRHCTEAVFPHEFFHVHHM